MATIRAADGGYLLNSDQFNYTKDAQGRPVLNVVGGGGTVTEAEIEKALGYKPIGANDVPVKKVNGATGEVKSTFYVTVTPENNNSATADKTAAEVYAAYAAGYAVYVIVTFDALKVPLELPLVSAVNMSGVILLGFAALGSMAPNSAPMYPTIMYDGIVGKWYAWLGTLARDSDIPTIPTALKNPHQLNIKIGNATTSYDGSAEKTVEILEGGDFKSNGTVPMSGNLYMNGNNIMCVKSISNTDSGMAIESEVSLNNHKITDLLDQTAGQDAATKAYVDGHSLLGDDGKIDSDLNMNEHGIVNAHRISTDGLAPLYIGSTIEPTGTNAPRLTGSNDGTAAFVKADTQATYVPVSVGAPTSVNHATTKEYVDGKTGAIQASAILKSGGTMVGKLKLTAEPTEDNDAVDKGYVDAILPAFTAADNGKVLGIVNGALVWVDKAGLKGE